MTRSFLAAALLAAAAFLSPVAAQQQQFNVGDRVTITATGEKGTVLASTPNPNGGYNIKVHLDRFGQYPVGPTYDTSVVQITKDGGGDGQAPADPGAPGLQPPPMQPPPMQPPPMQPIVPPAAAPVAPQGPAQAGNGASFAVGQHVTIAYSGEGGTVVAVDGPNTNGGYNVKIHLDRLDPNAPQVGPTYDTSVVQIN